MPFPTGWPPRPATTNRSIRFYVAGTLTADYADNAYLFIDGANANTFVPIPYVRAGDIRRVHVGGESGTPYGTGQLAQDGEFFRPNALQRGYGGGTAQFTLQGTAATGTLTGVGNVLNGETVTIDGKVYLFETVLTNVDGHVLIGVDLAASLSNLAAAIVLGPGAGSVYASATTLHPTVTATSTPTTLEATAKVVGTSGNSITTTETSATLSWGGATLSGGTGGDYVQLYIPSPSPLFSDVLVGKEIKIEGATSPGNDGTFTITSVLSGRVLEWANSSAVTELFPAAGMYTIRFIEEAVKKAHIWAGTIKITNKGANILYFSFDGETDHGEVQPAGAVPTEAIYRNRHEGGIAVKGTAADDFVIEAW